MAFNPYGGANAGTINPTTFAPGPAGPMSTPTYMLPPSPNAIQQAIANIPGSPQPSGPPVAAAGNGIGDGTPQSNAFLGALAAQQSAYEQALNEGMASARANIQSQLGSVLGDISHREGLAHEAIGTLPGQLNAIYQPATAQVGALANQLTAAQDASGLTHFMPSAEISAPITAAMTQSLASRQSDVPLLNIAAQAAFAKQSQAAHEQAAQQLSDLAIQNAGKAADYKSHLGDLVMQGSMHEHAADAQAQRSLQLFEAEHGLAAGNKTQPLYNTSTDRGNALAAAAQQGDKNALAERSSDTYRTGLALIQHSMPAPGDAAHFQVLQQALNAVAGGDSKTLNALAKSGDQYTKDLMDTLSKTKLGAIGARGATNPGFLSNALSLAMFDSGVRQNVLGK
jgi:hypothetical protein